MKVPRAQLLCFNPEIAFSTEKSTSIILQCMNCSYRYEIHNGEGSSFLDSASRLYYIDRVMAAHVIHYHDRLYRSNEDS
jgi:hypothetical protein